MERNKQLNIIQAINTKLNELEKQRNVYLNLLCEDISGDTEEFILATLRKEFILATLREINEDIAYLEGLEDIVYLEGLQEEILNGNEDNS